jgi:cytochrome c-type biogenesis protein CcmE
MVFVALIVLCGGGAAAFGLFAFQENMMFFVTPSDMLSNPDTNGKTFRLGGMVKEGTVKRAEGSLDVTFTVTDMKHDLPVTYTGVLPDLFREGQGVIARGRFVNGAFCKKNRNRTWRHDAGR